MTLDPTDPGRKGVQGPAIISRRNFLDQGMRVSLSAAGVLTVGLDLTSCASLAHGRSGEGRGAFEPNAWLRFLPDGRVIFMLDRAEMGQGVIASLPIILAEELELDPAQLEVEFAPADRKYGNPEVMNIQMTGGSSSVKGAFTTLREAGAQTRWLFVDAAAKAWGVAPEAIQVRDGMLSHQPTGRSASYSELLIRAARTKPREPSSLKLKDPSQFRRIGIDAPARGLLAKVTGQAKYGIDTKNPNQLVAIVARPPAAGLKCKNFDGAAALGLNGVRQVFQVPSGIAIVGSTYWHVRRAVDALKILWEGSPTLPKVHADIEQGFLEALKENGKVVKEEAWSEDDFTALGKVGKVIEAVYEVPYLAHATLEPQNCTVLWSEFACEVWVPTQALGLAHEVVRRVTGLRSEHIKVHSTLLGGGFGRRLYQDFVVEALTVAEQVRGVPVKLVWSREDDQSNDYYRPAAAHQVRGCLTADQRILAYDHKVATSSVLSDALPVWLPGLTPTFFPPGLSLGLGGLAARGFKSGLLADDTSFEGIPSLPYKIERLRVRSVQCDPGIPVGFWRSVGHSHSAFAVESFIDELAVAAKQDPLAFRLAHLAPDSAYRRVLEAVAEVAGWRTSPTAGIAPNVFRGLAVHSCFGSCVAQVVDVEWAGPSREIVEGSFRIRDVFVAVDCGQVVQPDTVRAQMEGSVIFGLSAALYGKISFVEGRVLQDNFDTYRLLRYGQSPNIRVILLASHERPQGVGEPGVPPVAPALANALFRASGNRIRKLPIF